MHRKHAEEIVDKIIVQMKQARLDANLSHEKLADACKLHRSTISLIESRKRQPTLLTCLLIADALNVDLSKIIDDVTR